MLLKTILNRVAPQKSFVYGKVSLVSKGKQLALEVEIEARRNSRAVCSGCHRKRPGYDQLPVLISDNYTSRRRQLQFPLRTT